MKAKILKALLLWILLIIVLYFRSAELGQIITADEWQWMRRGVDFSNKIVDGQIQDSLLFAPWDENLWIQWMMTRWFLGISYAVSWLNSQDISQESNHLWVWQLTISLVTFLMILIVTYQIWKLTQNNNYALISFLFLSLDPFILSYSRVIHVDAILAFLMIVSALFILLGEKEQKFSYFILSWIFAGLAIIQKAPAVFLLPYLWLILLIGLYYRTHTFKRAFTYGVIWLFVALISIFVAWPALWTDLPLALTWYLNWTLYHVNWQQGFSYLFGQSVDSIWLKMIFYPVNLLIKANLLLWLGFVLFVCTLFKKKEFWQQNKMYLIYLVCFVGFFLIEMTLGWSKDDRYMLPAYLAFVLFISFVWTYLTTLWSKYFYSLLLWIAFFFSAINAYYNPYYLTYRSELLYASADGYILYWWGEGLESIAWYLNQHANGNSAYSQSVGLLNYFVKNRTLYQLDNFTCSRKLPWEYVVFYNSSLNRWTNKEFYDWLLSNWYIPEEIITIKGIDYGWIFKTDEKIIAYIEERCFAWNLQIQNYITSWAMVASNDVAQMNEVATVGTVYNVKDFPDNAEKISYVIYYLSNLSLEDEVYKYFKENRSTPDFVARNYSGKDFAYVFNVHPEDREFFAMGKIGLNQFLAKNITKKWFISNDLNYLNTYFSGITSYSINQAADYITSSKYVVLFKKDLENEPTKEFYDILKQKEISPVLANKTRRGDDFAFVFEVNSELEDIFDKWDKKTSRYLASRLGANPLATQNISLATKYFPKNMAYKIADSGCYSVAPGYLLFYKEWLDELKDRDLYLWLSQNNYKPFISRNEIEKKDYSYVFQVDEKISEHLRDICFRGINDTVSYMKKSLIVWDVIASQNLSVINPKWDIGTIFTINDAACHSVMSKFVVFFADSLSNQQDKDIYQTLQSLTTPYIVKDFYWKEYSYIFETTAPVEQYLKTLCK